MNGSNKINH